MWGPPLRSLHHRLRTRRAAERLRSESASSDELSWIQSSYLIAEIIVIPLSAWLSCVMSTRWLLAASAAGFTLASVLCGSASDMRAMIVFRGATGLLRRLDDSDCVHGRRRLVSR